MRIKIVSEQTILKSKMDYARKQMENFRKINYYLKKKQLFTHFHKKKYFRIMTMHKTIN